MTKLLQQAFDAAAQLPADQQDELAREWIREIDAVRDQEALAQAEEIARRIDWKRKAQTDPPDPKWLEGSEPKPF